MSILKRLFPVWEPPRPCGIPRGTTRRAVRGEREFIHARRSRNRCEGESCVGSLTAGAHQRDFEGRRVEGFRRGRSLRDRAPREFRPKARIEDTCPRV